MSTNHRLHALAPSVLSAAALSPLTGGASLTPIGELLDNASRYNGKTVRIEGEVRGPAGGFGVGGYQVRDRTGTLPVVSERASPPRTARGSA